MNDPLGSAAPCCWPLGAPAFTHPSAVSLRQSEPGESLRALSLSRGGPSRIRGGFSVFLFYPIPTPPQTHQIVHPDLPAFRLGDSPPRSLSSQTHRGDWPSSLLTVEVPGVGGAALPCAPQCLSCASLSFSRIQTWGGGGAGSSEAEPERPGGRQAAESHWGWGGSKQLIRRATWLVAASKLSPSRGHPKAAPANCGPQEASLLLAPPPTLHKRSSFPSCSHPPSFAGFLGFG